MTKLELRCCHSATAAFGQEDRRLVPRRPYREFRFTQPLDWPIRKVRANGGRVLCGDGSEGWDRYLRSTESRRPARSACDGPVGPRDSRSLTTRSRCMLTCDVAGPKVAAALIPKLIVPCQPVPERTECEGALRSSKDRQDLVRPGDVLVAGNVRGDLIRMTSSPPIWQQEAKAFLHFLPALVSHLFPHIGHPFPHISHPLSHISYLVSHSIRPSVGPLGRGTEEMRWQHSYDNANNGADRAPYREKAVSSIHGS